MLVYIANFDIMMSLKDIVSKSNYFLLRLRTISFFVFKEEKNERKIILSR